MGLFEFLKRAGSKALTKKNAKTVKTPEIIKMEEEILKKADLVVASLLLHWCGRLDVVLAEWARLLSPGGLLLFSTYGPDTLAELRRAFSLAGPGLNGFRVNVECSYTQHVQGTDNFNVYAIAATAEFGSFGDPDYVSRTLQVTATDLF